MWDQGSKGWDQGSEVWEFGITAPGSGITSCYIRISNQQSFEGSGIRLYHVCGIKDQFVMLFNAESRIRNLGTKVGSAMK